MKIRIVSDGRGSNTEVHVVRDDDTTERIPYVRRIEWSIDARGLAVAKLELTNVETYKRVVNVQTSNEPEQPEQTVESKALSLIGAIGLAFGTVLRAYVPPERFDEAYAATKEAIRATGASRAHGEIIFATEGELTGLGGFAWHDRMPFARSRIESLARDGITVRTLPDGRLQAYIPICVIDELVEAARAKHAGFSVSGTTKEGE